MKKIIFALLCCCCVNMNAVTLEEANQAYQNGDYAQSVTSYELLLQEGVAPELYYNLGNAYYKQNEIGKSILAYERALRLRPFYKDATYNLDLARERIIDNVEDNQRSFLIVWFDALIHLLNSNTWVYLSIITLIVASICFLSFAFARRLLWRKISFHFAWVALLLCASFGIFAGIAYHRFTARSEAIVMQGVASVKSSPDAGGTDLFILHEGTKVTIKDQLGEWDEIVLPNGHRGWIERKMIERI